MEVGIWCGNNPLVRCRGKSGNFRVEINEEFSGKINAEKNKGIISEKAKIRNDKIRSDQTKSQKQEVKTRVGRVRKQKCNKIIGKIERKDSGKNGYYYQYYCGRNGGNDRGDDHEERAKEFVRILLELLRYIADSRSENVTNSEIQEIQKMVDEIKQNSEIGVRYMQSWEFRQICHEEGYKDGYNNGYGNGYESVYDKGDHQGDSRRLIEDVENLMKNLKMDLPTACESLGMTVDVYEHAKQELMVEQD